MADWEDFGPTTTHDNPLHVEQLFSQVWRTVELCWQHEKSHNYGECDCLWCSEVAGLEWILRRVHSMLESCLYPCPALHRYRQRIAEIDGEVELAADHARQAREMETMSSATAMPILLEDIQL